MKTIKRFLATILMVISVFSFGMTCTAEESWELLLGNVVDGSILTNEQESSGEAIKIARGYYLSDGSSYISDQGNNMVYISGSTSCYRTADELRANVYLERLVDGEWKTVTYQYHSEYNTYYTHNGFYVLVAPGYFYRTVTNHVAIKGDTVEYLTSQTDGLYIG